MAKEKKKEPEKDKTGTVPAYMLTYGDMMTLLLCFFVLLISISTMEVEKLQQAAASLKGALSALPFQERVTPAPVLQQRPVRGIERRGRRSRAISRLRRVIREHKLEKVIRIDEDSQGIHITIGDPALFDSGRAVIKNSILPVLNQIVEVVHSGDEIIRVEGHTDTVPIHNDEFDDNWELSIARSLSVIRYIRARGTIDPKRLRPVGCAEFHPIETNDTPEGRALNRRVEIFIEMAE
ncbi:flagellar motor protein MotB [Candidatus Latescibacterota bacterium]